MESILLYCIGENIYEIISVVAGSGIAEV